MPHRLGAEEQQGQVKLAPDGARRSTPVN